ncbi:cytochrome c oxidase subunit 3 [Kangiella sp. HD9-110m-PIT-SAG07]|nr:cytochrome c oxidase subunit 3 [Kangiella sp. HD9-110m-PIT-SAG07]
MSEQQTTEYEKYYVPEQSKLPFIGSIGLLLTAFGAGHMVQGNSSLSWIMYLGLAVLVYMLSTWWSSTIRESHDGLYSAQMSRSFRQGMIWFITSEVMFFAAFFGALFYGRVLVMEWLGGGSNNAATHDFLYPDFVPTWPMTSTPGELNNGAPTTWEAMGAWGLPAINTAILLFSSFTLTIAHHALIEKNRQTLILFTSITALLGVIFMMLQVEEYIHAYQEMGLTLGSGFYGSTFFLLTGFHGLHVTVGTIFLIVMALRCAKGHFTPKDHFAYEAGAWYWHFVDVVWVFLFIFVYIL